MSNLEQAITDWREEMLAAGIQSPTPLEELESHLRDDIERQLQSGATELRAFELAVQRIGHPGALKTEFARSKRLVDRLGIDMPTRINHVLGAFWLAISVRWFCSGCVALSTFWFHAIKGGAYSFALLMSLIFTGLFLIGIFASVSLFRGEQWGRNRIRLISILWLLTASSQLWSQGTLTPAGYFITVFALTSAILLTLPRFTKPTLA